MNMSTQLDLIEILKPGLLGKWLAERSDIWQMDLLDDRGLSKFARDRGINFWHYQIKQLWQLRLLRADLVISTRKLDPVGLIEAKKGGSGRKFYADERILRRRTKGWGSAAAKLRSLPSSVKLYFHPFRYYVLYHLDRILQVNIHPMQVLIAAERYPNLLDRILSVFLDWSASYQFLKSVHNWNSITALAVATEPCVYERLFKKLKYPPTIDFDRQRERIQEHWKEVAECYRKIGPDTIEEFRKQLCINAELLDPNKDVHMILRLMGSGFRSKIKGRLGGSLHLLTMAEMLRRAAEEEFGVELREEDELGFGITPEGLKKRLYDSDRILNGSRTEAGEFLRKFGLDYGTRLRWYVEGETEYGALDTVFGRYSAIDLVNLRGNVFQKGGKGVSFRDSLRSDLNARIFSFILIDKDNKDYVRVLRKAVERDEVCGMIFVSDPDFEFHNFTHAELEEILWQIAVENGAPDSARKMLHGAIIGVRSANELWSEAKRAMPELRKSGKGMLWGAKLMQFALNNPQIRDEALGKEKNRPVVEAVNAAIRAVRVNYLLSRREYQIDPSNWALVKRRVQSQ